MKRILVIAAALSLLIPAMASAAPDKPHKDHHAGTTKPAKGEKPVHKPHKPPGGGGNYKPPHKPGTRPPHKPDTRPPHKPGKPPHRPGWGNNRPGHRPGKPGGGYHKPRPSQYYWRGRWFGRVHAAAFRYPAGYHYRIWNEGDRLPVLFLNSAYYYDGYAQLGLEVPPPGYRWVRYGPDLLLVDINTNEVEQVVYGAFY